MAGGWLCKFMFFGVVRLGIFTARGCKYVYLRKDVVYIFEFWVFIEEQLHHLGTVENEISRAQVHLIPCWTVASGYF